MRNYIGRRLPRQGRTRGSRTAEQHSARAACALDPARLFWKIIKAPKIGMLDRQTEKIRNVSLCPTRDDVIRHLGQTVNGGTEACQGPVQAPHPKDRQNDRVSELRHPTLRAVVDNPPRRTFWPGRNHSASIVK